MTKGGNWSDPLAWPLQEVPSESYEEVIIEPYMTIYLDVKTPKLRKVTVYGKLIFSVLHSEIELLCTELEIWGELRAGESLDTPWTGRSGVISLWDPKTENDAVSRELIQQELNPPVKRILHHSFTDSSAGPRVNQKLKPKFPYEKTQIPHYL